MYNRLVSVNVAPLFMAFITRPLNKQQNEAILP